MNSSALLSRNGARSFIFLLLLFDSPFIGFWRRSLVVPVKDVGLKRMAEIFPGGE
jgi:hypothetical protein